MRVNPDRSQTWEHISWLPADFETRREIDIFKNLPGAAWREIRGKKYSPVPGANFDLTKTLRWASEAGHSVRYWGPYPIQGELFELAQKRIEHLNTSGVQYVADDRDARKTGEAVNCMHAVSDMTPDRSGRGGFLGIGYGVWGFKGTRHTLRHYKKSLGHLLVDPASIDEKISQPIEAEQLVARPFLAEPKSAPAASGKKTSH